MRATWLRSVRMLISSSPDGVHDLIEIGGLVERARGAGLDRPGGLRPVEAGAEHECLSPRAGLPEFRDQVGAVAVRQPEIEHRDIDLVEQLAGLGQRPRLPDDGEIGLALEHRRDRLPHGGVVLHEQDVRLFGCSVANRFEGHLEADRRTGSLPPVPSP